MGLFRTRLSDPESCAVSRLRSGPGGARVRAIRVLVEEGCIELLGSCGRLAQHLEVLEVGQRLGDVRRVVRVVAVLVSRDHNSRVDLGQLREGGSPVLARFRGGLISARPAIGTAISVVRHHPIQGLRLLAGLPLHLNPDMLFTGLDPAAVAATVARMTPGIGTGAVPAPGPHPCAAAVAVHPGAVGCGHRRPCRPDPRHTGDRPAGTVPRSANWKASATT